MNKKLGLFLLPMLLLFVVGAQAATAPAPKPKAAAKTVTPAIKVAKPLNTAESRAVVAKALKFVSDILVDPGTKVKIEATKKDGNFFFLTITLGEGADSQKVEAVMTKNGKYFFPQVMEVDKLVANKKAAAKTATAPAPKVNVPQTDKPAVELFVMSYCPYGTQIEKGIIPVVEALGANIDFKLKFVSYTMHGDKENTENTTQYCLDQEQPDKFLPYLKCFLEAGDSAGCLTKTGVDQTKLTACVTAANQQFDLKGTSYSIYQEANKKYGVQGSPTLVINGVEVNSGRSPKALADTICQAFTAGKQPTACQNAFDSATPAPGFGGTASASNAQPASCH